MYCSAATFLPPDKPSPGWLSIPAVIASRKSPVRWFHGFGSAVIATFRKQFAGTQPAVMVTFQTDLYPAYMEGELTEGSVSADDMKRDPYFLMHATFCPKGVRKSFFSAAELATLVCGSLVDNSNQLLVSYIHHEFQSRVVLRKAVLQLV